MGSGGREVGAASGTAGLRGPSTRTCPPSSLPMTDDLSADDRPLDDDFSDDDLLADDFATDENQAPASDPDAVPDMGENFGLDAEPGTKGVKAFGAGLSGDVGGNSAGGSNDPDTYRDAPSSGAKTGGGGL